MIEVNPRINRLLVACTLRSSDLWRTYLDQLEPRERSNMPQAISRALRTTPNGLLPIA